jgi:hypothetical protein
MRVDYADNGRYATADIDVEVLGGSITVGASYWAGRSESIFGEVLIHVTFRGPRGGYHTSLGLDPVSGEALRTMLQAPERGRLMVKDNFGARLIVAKLVRSHRLEVRGSRGHRRACLDARAHDLLDIAAAIRFCREAVTP